MAETLFAYLLSGLALVAFIPTAIVLLASDRARAPLGLTAAVTLALFAGSLSLVMLWEGLLGLPFSALGIAIPALALALPGLWRWRRLGRPLPARPALTRWEAGALALIGLIAAAILFNALAIPFYRDDTLGIYLPQAQALVATRALLPLTGADSLYLAYPMLSQHLYAFAFLASGWENDYLAKALTTLLSLGCLLTAFALGERAAGRRGGWLAALLLALTPAFGRWASSGYADLPMAFFYSLSAVFALRLWDRGQLRDAALAGAAMGLALWTKNAALVGAAVLAVALCASWLRGRASWRATTIGLGALLLLAGPWYLRNLLGAGFLMPDTVWSERASATIDTLLTLLNQPGNFALSGWLGFFGVLWAVVLIARRGDDAPALAAMLWWALPLFALWWLFASYDPRFLLYILPMTSALGAVFLNCAYTSLGERAQQISRWGFAAFALGMTVYMLSISVEYKWAHLRAPLMSDAERRALVGRD
jgi:hypothetical protein